MGTTGKTDVPDHKERYDFTMGVVKLPEIASLKKNS
jgi:hypothetical protein